MKKTAILTILIIFFSTGLLAQFGSQDSGGKLSPFQACYDVKFYDINLTIDLNEKAIGGSVVMLARAVNDFNKILVDLDGRYRIDAIQSISDGNKTTDLKFYRDSNKVWIDFPETIKTAAMG